MAWSVVAALALLLQGIFAFTPVQAADSFVISAASICSASGKTTPEAGSAHEDGASHCPLCQSLQPSLGLTPPATHFGLTVAVPSRLAAAPAAGTPEPTPAASFRSRAPPIPS